MDAGVEGGEGDKYAIMFNRSSDRGADGGAGGAGAGGGGTELTGGGGCDGGAASKG